MRQTYYFESTAPEPHADRTRKILAAHPEVKSLFGHTPSTALWVVLVVAIQLVTMVLLRESPIWVILLAGYTVGAVCNHALWALIHDCTHNLVFKGSPANQLLAIFANLPIIFPSAISFRIYHIKHHIYQGDLDRDADLARPFEARLVGNSAVRKALWLLLFPFSQLVRVPFLKGISFMNGWVLLNNVVQIGFLVAVVHFLGWSSFGYLVASSFFSIGLHPLGARWIQEHYVVKPGQETYSYYGPLNQVSFNVGYHNEHHDLMRVPWSRLPRVRAMAPEFYDTLHWHKSWTALLMQFIFDGRLSLFSRVTRSASGKRESRAPGAAAVPPSSSPSSTMDPATASPQG